MKNLSIKSILLMFYITYNALFIFYINNINIYIDIINICIIISLSEHINEFKKDND